MWRKIGELGLVDVYKDKDSAEGKWLHHFFGLPLLPPNLVEPTFVDGLMADCPGDDNLLRFADYVLVTYIGPHALFPPPLWAREPNPNFPHTNNAIESFHSKLCGFFDTPHPNIYAFVEGLHQIQAENYITLHSLHQPVAVNSVEASRRQYAAGMLQRLNVGDISAYDYAKAIGYRYLPVTE